MERFCVVVVDPVAVERVFDMVFDMVHSLQTMFASIFRQGYIKNENVSKSDDVTST